MPKGIPLTEEMQEKRREEIFAASVHLFLKKGFNETSLRKLPMLPALANQPCTITTKQKMTFWSRITKRKLKRPSPSQKKSTCRI